MNPGVIRASQARVTYAAEVDIASALHDERLLIETTPLSATEISRAQEKPDVARVFYTDGGLKYGRGTAAFLESWNGGSDENVEVITGLCSSYRAERRALISVCAKMLADRRRGEKAIVFTDSLSNSQSLESAKSKHDDEEDVLL